MDLLARGAWLALLAGAALASATLAWARISYAEAPQAVLTILPWHPAALLQVGEAARRAESPQAELKVIGKNMMRMAPLLEAPLVYLGLDSADAGDRDTARLAFLSAVQRQPRNVPALSWLAADAITRHKFNQAVSWLDQLRRVDPANRHVYTEAMVYIAHAPGGGEVFDRELDRKSHLAMAAAEKIVLSSGDLGRLMRIGEVASEFRPRIVGKLLREKDVEAAFVAWLAFLPSSEAERLSWPYDPAFVGSEAAAPFNWELFDDAELLDEGGLLVRYSGRGSQTFVRQTMLLGPGSYRLTAYMDGELSGSGGGFVWSIACVREKRIISETRVTALSMTLSTHNAEFLVPASGCDMQTLTLEGKPGPLVARARATVKRVAIQQVVEQSR
jgi:hypothetical protein